MDCQWGECQTKVADISQLVKHLHEEHMAMLGSHTDEPGIGGGNQALEGTTTTSSSGTGPSSTTFRCLWRGCSRDGQPLASRSSLVAHLRVHTGDKPFPCRHCERAFPRADSLSKHVKAFHAGIDTAESSGTTNTTAMQQAVSDSKTVLSDILLRKDGGNQRVESTTIVAPDTPKRALESTIGSGSTKKSRLQDSVTLTSSGLPEDAPSPAELARLLHNQAQSMPLFLHVPGEPLSLQTVTDELSDAPAMPLTDAQLRLFLAYFLERNTNSVLLHELKDLEAERVRLEGHLRLLREKLPL